MITPGKIPDRLFSRKNYLRISTIDMHTAGEPLRVILEGYPEIKGQTVLERRRYARDNLDHLRKALMWEPRGHTDMYGCLIVPPDTEEADFGIIFMHNEGYSTMCGHAVIAITKLAVESGWVDTEDPVTEVKIQAPCGLIRAFARIKEERVVSVYFHNVPSFVIGLDRSVNVGGIGSLKYDLAYGGAFYAYLEAEQLELDLVPENAGRFIELGRSIKKEVSASSADIIHPFEPELGFLYGVIFTGPAREPGNDSRNICVFADGEVDRSPTGSGVAGRMAIDHARGSIQPGEFRKTESIIGTVFTGGIVEDMKYGPYQAIKPSVEGTAFITGRHEFLIDPEDPFREGFLLK